MMEPTRIKRQRGAGEWQRRMANGFSRLTRSRVEVLVRGADWRAWEVGCFELLHGPEFTAREEGRRVRMDVLPGENLSQRLESGTLSPAMLAAAAAELRRAHELQSEHFGGAWSHGDPHTGNFFYDVATGRARLIDFELRHVRTLSADERHVEDLLVLLLDVCGRCSAGAWLPLAWAFLRGYESLKIVALVREKLNTPRGFARLRWAVQTRWLPRVERERRMGELASALDAVEMGAL